MDNMLFRQIIERKTRILINQENYFINFSNISDRDNFKNSLSEESIIIFDIKCYKVINFDLFKDLWFMTFKYKFTDNPVYHVNENFVALRNTEGYTIIPMKGVHSNYQSLKPCSFKERLAYVCPVDKIDELISSFLRLTTIDN